MNAELLAELDKRIERQLERVEEAQKVRFGTYQEQAQCLAFESQVLEALVRAARA